MSLNHDLQIGSDVITDGLKQTKEKPGQTQLESSQAQTGLAGNSRGNSPVQNRKYGQQLQRVFPEHQRPPSQAEHCCPDVQTRRDDVEFRSRILCDMLEGGGPMVSGSGSPPDSDVWFHPAAVSRRNRDRKQTGKEFPTCLSAHLSGIITQLLLLTFSFIPALLSRNSSVSHCFF